MLISIDPKALEHACQCAGRAVHHFDRMALDLPLRASIVAHARAIEQHEAFKREVSDAIELNWSGSNFGPPAHLVRFIIAKPDPLVEVWDHMIVTGNFGPLAFRAAIEARGGRIVWEGE